MSKGTLRLVIATLLCGCVYPHHEVDYHPRSRSTAYVQRLPDEDTALDAEEPQHEDKEFEGEWVQAWGTLYYMKQVDPSPGVPLRDMNDRVIGPEIRATDWCLAAIEGTVKVDGVVYNYAGTRNPPQADCSHAPSSRVRWRKSPYSYGIGNRNNPLRPFKSVATDPEFVPPGSRIFIPEAKGTTYTFNGQEKTHDGVFYADDVGGMVKGNQIDFFIGGATGQTDALKRNPFDFVRSTPSQEFEIQIIE